MQKPITVLSLFDGISVAQQALKELGYKPEYYASEVDKYAIEITQKNHPETIQLGDIRELSFSKKGFYTKDSNRSWEYTGGIDLLIGGSPCQDLSIAKANREGLKGKRSSLFYEYVRLLKEAKPKYFVLENVASMSAENRDIITKELGVEPILINAALVSAQQRKRLFWTNIPSIKQPDDRHIYLKDILLPDTYTEKEKAYCLDANYYKGASVEFYLRKGKRQKVFNKPIVLGCASRTYPRNKKLGVKRQKQIEIRKDEKANALTTVRTDSLVALREYARALHPIECERLQSLPDNYTEGVSKTQRLKTLGNAFNKEVIKHILSYI